MSIFIIKNVKKNNIFAQTSHDYAYIQISSPKNNTNFRLSLY
jgi:hypothetical protein